MDPAQVDGGRGPALRGEIGEEEEEVLLGAGESVDTQHVALRRLRVSLEHRKPGAVGAREAAGGQVTEEVEHAFRLAAGSHHAGGSDSLWPLAAPGGCRPAQCALSCASTATSARA